MGWVRHLWLVVLVGGCVDTGEIGGGTAGASTGSTTAVPCSTGTPPATTGPNWADPWQPLDELDVPEDMGMKVDAGGGSVEPSGWFYDSGSDTYYREVSTLERRNNGWQRGMLLVAPPPETLSDFENAETEVSLWLPAR